MSINLELEKKILNLIKAFNDNLFDDVIKNAGDIYTDNENIAILPNLIGASYAGKNDHKNAIKFFKKALNLDNTNTQIFNNLGKSLIALKQYKEAIDFFYQSKELDNKNFDTYLNLGIIYFNIGDYSNSLKNYNHVIKLNSKVDKAYYNSGVTLSKIGNNKKAIKFFLETLKINPRHIKALNNLGLLYLNDNNYDLAFFYLNKAIDLDVNYAKAYNNLGALCLQKKDYDLALKYFDKAYSLDNQLIISGVQKHFLKRLFCDWTNENELTSILDQTISLNDQVSPWFCLSMEDNINNHYIRAKKFSSKFNLLKKNNNNYLNKKIKIGYYAADFHQHAGMINMEGIFKNHNKDEFEIIAFYYGEIKKDKTHNRISQYFDNFFYVNDLDDEEILKLSIDNKIDIAIYRAGLTINSRSSIFSQKVAPIQINFLGYPGTTGQEGIDYIIGDRFVIPENHEKYYSENIIFLTDCYYPRDNNRKISNNKFLRDKFNIPKNSFVFSSFNNSYKITSEEFIIWMNLLTEVKNSVLLLLASDEKMKLNLVKEASKMNIESSRIIFLEKTNLEDHLSRHSLADLFLDSFNCNAHTSAVDALWAGLPILTKVGNSFSSRICGSLNSYFDLNELIVYSKEDYFKKAKALATDPLKYRKIKDKIIKAKELGVFFDTKRYTLNLEKAYKKIHKMRISDNKFENIFIDDNE